MPFQLRNSKSVGVAEFDNDHQAMLRLLEKIAVALKEGSQERAGALTDELLALARDHTAREEAFLRRIGFPGVEAVIAAQQDSLLRIAAMQDALVAYLLRADINYKSFVEAAGLSDTCGRLP
jgi:hemerythrin